MQVKFRVPTIPNPSEHVKEHTLPKLLPLLQTGSAPLVGAERAGQVIAVQKGFSVIIYGFTKVKNNTTNNSYFDLYMIYQ